MIYGFRKARTLSQKSLTSCCQVSFIHQINRLHAALALAVEHGARRGCAFLKLEIFLKSAPRSMHGGCVSYKVLIFLSFVVIY